MQAGKEEAIQMEEGPWTVLALSSHKLFVPPGPSVYSLTAEGCYSPQLTSPPRGLDNCVANLPLSTRLDWKSRTHTFGCAYENVS